MKTFLLFLCTAAAIGATQAQARLVLHRTVTVNAKLAAPLNAKTLHDGTRFLLLAENMRIGDTLLPSGSVLEGHIENLSDATPRREAAMDMLIESVRLPNASARPMRARLHFLSKTKGDLMLKKGTAIHMKTIADIPEPIVLSVATPAKHHLEASPTMRRYDEDEQFPF